jgi:hypothetical protein
MEKVPEDPFGPEPVSQELYDQCKLDRDQCRQQLDLCKQERDNCQAGPGEPDPVPNTTPACRLHLIGVKQVTNVMKVARLIARVRLIGPSLAESVRYTPSPLL